MRWRATLGEKNPFNFILSLKKSLKLFFRYQLCVQAQVAKKGSHSVQAQKRKSCWNRPRNFDLIRPLNKLTEHQINEKRENNHLFTFNSLT